MRPLGDGGRSLAADLLAALLGLVLLLGTLEVHGGAAAHSALDRPTVVFTGARHASQPTHLETSGVRDLARCAWCLLQLQGLGNALPALARLAGPMIGRGAVGHLTGAPTSRPRNRTVSRGPPLA